MSDRKEALIVWNEFQVAHFEPIYELLEDPYFIILNKDYNHDLAKCSILNSGKYKFKIIRQEDIYLLDDAFNIVFFQSPFPNMHLLKNAKLASYQYGLAKEDHNYGVWRSLADIHFVYGEYTKDILSCYSPSVMMGHPRLLKKAPDNNSANVLTEKKSILFMPTWGDLGSAKHVLPALAAMTSQYEVKFKFHHNDLKVKARDPFLLAESVGIPKEAVFGPDIDTFECIRQADVIVSDFSGAIFDAVLLQKPVILVQVDAQNKIGVQKFNLNSIEFSRSSELGLVCTNIEYLPTLIEEAIDNLSALTVRSAFIREELFDLSEPARIGERFKAACDGVVCGLIKKTQSQDRITDLVRENLRARNTTKSKPDDVRLHEKCSKAVIYYFLLTFLRGRLREKYLKRPKIFFHDSTKPLVKLLGKLSGY